MAARSTAVSTNATPAATSDHHRPGSAGRTSRSSLAEQAYRQLKEGILHNKYPPGFTATEAEIANITGHSLRDVHAILDMHYLARDPALGDNAIRKLERGTDSSN